MRIRLSSLLILGGAVLYVVDLYLPWLDEGDGWFSSAGNWLALLVVLLLGCWEALVLSRAPIPNQALRSVSALGAAVAALVMLNAIVSLYISVERSLSDFAYGYWLGACSILALSGGAAAALHEHRAAAGPAPRPAHRELWLGALLAAVAFGYGVVLYVPWYGPGFAFPGWFTASASGTVAIAALVWAGSGTLALVRLPRPLLGQALLAALTSLLIVVIASEVLRSSFPHNWRIGIWLSFGFAAVFAAIAVMSAYADSREAQRLVHPQERR